MKLKLLYNELFKINEINVYKIRTKLLETILICKYFEYNSEQLININ